MSYYWLSLQGLSTALPVTPTGISVKKHQLPFQGHLSQVPLTGGGPGLTDWEKAGQHFYMGTARDITTSAMLVSCQLPQGWEGRGCQTAKISGQAGPSTQMHRGGGAGAGARDFVCNWRGRAYGWGSRFKPLFPGLRVAGYRYRLPPASSTQQRGNWRDATGVRGMDKPFLNAGSLTFVRLPPPAPHTHPKPQAQALET